MAVLADVFASKGSFERKAAWMQYPDWQVLGRKSTGSGLGVIIESISFSKSVVEQGGRKDLLKELETTSFNGGNH